MANYIGFSTINADKPRITNPINNLGRDYGSASITRPYVFGKKYKLTDSQLVIQDFVNALNIHQGQKVGQPAYGTTLWSFVFEPNTADVQFQLENEIRRVASLDPRIELNYVKAFPQENGILLEVEMAVNPFNSATTLSLFFDNRTNTASLQQ
jgi:phage baseplate assembly protein W